MVLVVAFIRTIRHAAKLVVIVAIEVQHNGLLGNGIWRRGPRFVAHLRESAGGGFTKGNVRFALVHQGSG